MGNYLTELKLIHSSVNSILIYSYHVEPLRKSRNYSDTIFMASPPQNSDLL
jgi:hypothetical protein